MPRKLLSIMGKAKQKTIKTVPDYFGTQQTLLFVSRVLSFRSSSRPDIGDSLVSSSTVDDNHEPGTSLGGAGAPDRPRDGLNPAVNNRPRTGGASKGPVPKWFKGTGKNRKCSVYWLRR